MKEWKTVAQNAVAAFEARWRAPERAAVAALADWLADVAPPLLVTTRRARVLWDVQRPTAVGALRAELREASGTAIHEMLADLQTIDRHTRTFQDALVEPAALPAPAREAEQRGYCYLHRERRSRAFGRSETRRRGMPSPQRRTQRPLLLEARQSDILSHRNQMRLHSLMAAWAGLVALLWPQPTIAYPTGISGYSGNHGSFCTACHSGGKVPTVALSGPSTLDPGTTGDFTFTVTSSAPSTQVAAGLDVAASAGTLIVVASEDEQLLIADLTHSSPKMNNASGQAAWSFKWKAPATPGLYTLWAAGNSVNLDTGSRGDNAARTTLMVSVGAVATDTPTPAPDTPTVAATDTPTATITPEATATSSPTETPTPTATDFPTSTATASASATATATPAATATPTPRGQPGDANCDGTLTAADVSAEVSILSGEDFPCGGSDANADGVASSGDVPTILQLLFEPLTL